MQQIPSPTKMNLHKRGIGVAKTLRPWHPVSAGSTVDILKMDPEIITFKSF